MAGVGMVSGLAILYLPNIPTLNQPVMPPGTNLGNAFLVSMRVFSIVMALGMSAFMLALFYLGARMQLVLFETTVTGQSIIAPIWKRYGRRTWRWIGIRILPSIVLVIPFVFMMLGLTRAIAHQQAEIQAGMAPASPFHLFRVVLGVVIGFWLIGGFAMFIGGLIADFTLPFIALEDTSYSLAWKRLAETIQNDPPGVALYALIKLCLGIALMIAGYLVFLIAIAVPVLLLGLCGYLLKPLLAHAGIFGSITMFLLITLAILVLLAYFIYTYVLLAGAVFTFLQAYTIYFLGGRYPLLGDLLEPPPPAFEPPLPEPSA